MNFKNFLKDYEAGLSYEKGDVVRVKNGAEGITTDYAKEIVDGKAVVLSQCPLCPNEYLCVGERRKYSSPSERFMKFEINGHDWERE